MAKKYIEVELRGPLNQKSYKEFLGYIKKYGKLIDKQNRVLIDYSTFIEGVGERKLDVRTRITNGKVELVVKKGKFGGTSREEASIFVENNDLENTLFFMAMIGYKKGVVADRGIERYKISGIEIAIQDVRQYGFKNKIHSRFFEAEVMSSIKSKRKAENKIRKFLDNFDLDIFEESEWYDYVKKMNKETNGVFNYGKNDIKKIRNLI